MQKIVFYGNCQLAVLSHILAAHVENFNSHFETLNAKDYSLSTIWRDDVGTVYPLAHSDDAFTSEFVKSIEKIVDDADVIVFQKIHGPPSKNRPAEILTDYIHSKYDGKKHMICIPSFWFSGYLSNGFKDGAQFAHIFLWLLEQGLSNSQILDWLKHEYDPKIEKLVNYNADKSIDELQKREQKESATYGCFIGIVDILSNYREQLICYNHHHPSAYYFNVLYKKLLDELGFKTDNEINIDCVGIPGGDFTPYANDFAWFRQVFQGIKGCSQQYYRANFLNADYVSKNVEIVKAYTQADIAALQPQLDILNS